MNHLKCRQGVSTVMICLALTSLLIGLVSPRQAHPQEKETPCLQPYINTFFPNAGEPGDQVRIRGRRFGLEAGKVTFSPEVEAKIVNWKNSRIWVVVPESAKSGPVTVSLPCGSVSNEKHFTVKE
ncbi:MAG: IPT/TIG domain-containing protein [Deltaproteobacteria bacterium]|nr:MAG: IPT/TIG domain-containing protein [Deltaproteobacteria bacterium]